MSTRTEEIKALVTLFDQLTKKVRQTGDELSKTLESKVEPKTLENIKETEKAIEKLNAETKEFQKTRQNQITQQAKLNSLRKGEQDELIKTRTEVQKETKAVKDRIKASNSLTPLLDKERKRLALMQKQLAETALRTGASSRETRKLAKSTQFLNEKILRAEKLGGKFQGQVGKYPQIVGKGIIAFAGIGAGIELFRRGIGAAINIAKDFEQSNANLAAVLGTTKENIGALTEDAKRLGAATSFSASQVSELQTEFAKLGFNEQEILNATEATLNLAAATGSELGEAAAIAGATLGGFGLGAEETGRVTDVMAKSFSTSALDIEKFKESMKTAAPAARAVGKTVEETTALLGTLANAGISGSKAGTGLKTSFINLNAAGLTMNEGFEKVNKSSDKLGTAVKLVGKEAAAAFLVLAEGQETTKELEIGLNNAGGAAERMAKEQLNTLEGSLKILNSAWEGFVLGLLSGDGAFSSFSRSIVEGTTALLGFFTAQSNAEEVSFETAKALRKEADESQNLLSEYESLVEDGIEPTSEEKERLEEITLQLKDRLGESVVAINEETGAFELNTKAVREQIKAKRLASDDEASQIASRLAGNIEEIKRIEAEIKANERNIETRRRLAEEDKKAKKESEKGLGGGILGGQSTATIKQTEAEKNLTNALSEQFKLKQDLIKQQDLAEERRLKLIELNFSEADALALINGGTEEGIEVIEEKTKAKKGLTDAEKAFNKAIKNQIALLKEQLKEELLLTKGNDLLQLDIKDKFANDVANLELQIIGQTNIEKTKINKELNNELLANDISRVEKQQEIEKKSAEERQKLIDKEIEATNKLTQFRLEQAAEIDVDAEDLSGRLSQIDERTEAEVEAAKFRAGVLLDNEELLADERILIEEQLQDELTEIQKKADADRLEEQKKADAESRRQRKELTDAALTIVETGLKKGSDARLKALDDDLKASEGQRDTLKDLAARGSRDALESITQAQKAEGEIRKQQEKEIQRQKQIEAGLTAFKVFAAKTEAGDKNALGSTIADMTVLQAFINSLPSAFDGTIDTGSGGNIDGKGGFLTVNHPHERTVSKKDNDKMGGISNELLGDIAQRYNKGLLMDAKDLSVTNNVVERFQSNEEIIAQYKELISVTKKGFQNMPVNNGYFSSFQQALFEVSKKGNTKKTTGYSIIR